MDPSYNNSFGSQGPAQGVIASGNGTPGAGAPGVTMSGNGTPGAGVPAQPAMPIASGTGAGDIVLAPEKKSKKGLVIGLVLGVVAVVVAVVVGVAVIGGGVYKNANDQNSQFFVFLDEHKDGVLVSTTIAKDVMGEKIFLTGFMLPEEEYEAQIEALGAAMDNLDELEEKLKNGPGVLGSKDALDLKEKYDNFKKQFLEEKQSYKTIVEITKKIYEVFYGLGEIEAKTYLSEYNELSEVATAIDNFLSSRKKIFNSNCSEDNILDECNKMVLDYESALAGLSDITILKRAYSDIFPDLKYIGEGSMIESFNVIYAALGEANEK